MAKLLEWVKAAAPAAARYGVGILAGVVLALLFAGELRAWLVERAEVRTALLVKPTKRFDRAAKIRIPVELEVADLEPAERERIRRDYGISRGADLGAPARSTGGRRGDRGSGRPETPATGEIVAPGAIPGLEGWDPLAGEAGSGRWELAGEWELPALEYGGTAAAILEGGRIDLRVKPKARPFVELLHRFRLEAGAGVGTDRELAALLAVDWRAVRTGRLDHGARIVALHAGGELELAALYVAGVESRKRR